MRAVLLLGLIARVAWAQSGPDDPPDKPTFTPPVLLEKVPAEYPPRAAAAGIEGTVVLEFFVDDKGVVSEITVKEQIGYGFDEAAVAAVKKFRWKPGMLGPVAVPSRVTY